jgi:hypothetical protein
MKMDRLADVAREQGGQLGSHPLVFSEEMQFGGGTLLRNGRPGLDERADALFRRQRAREHHAIRVATLRGLRRDFDRVEQHFDRVSPAAKDALRAPGGVGARRADLVGAVE